MMAAGLAAELQGPDELRAAIGRLRALGYRRLDALTPHPVPGLDEELGFARSRIPFSVLPAAIFGAALGFALQAFCNALDYPLDVGGRPPLSAPAFVPITFETAVLASALAAFFLLFRALRLPHLSHPLLSVDGIERATRDGFWVAIDLGDPQLDAERTPRELSQLGARHIAFFGRGAR